MAKRSIYAALASRFAHLALGAKEEDEDKDDKEARAEEKDEDEERPEEEGKKGKAAKKAKRADEEDGDGDDEARAEEKDEDEDEKDRKAEARGRDKECARWAAVLSSAEAKGRVPLACSLLADTSMSAEKIRTALTASPMEARQGLAARMATVQRPDVGSAPSAAQAGASTPATRAADIVAAYKKASGG